MTAVTISPHQLAILQQQHRDPPAAENSSRRHPSIQHTNRSASNQQPGRANEHPSGMEDAAGAIESRQGNVSDISDQKMCTGGDPRGRSQHLQFDLGDRSNTQTGLKGRESSSSTSDDQGPHLPQQSILVHRNVRPKTATVISRTTVPASHLVLSPPQDSDVEVISYADTNGHGRPKKQLLRAKSDLGPRGQSPSRATHNNEDEIWQLRHGWDDQYNSNEYLSTLSSVSTNIFPTASTRARVNTLLTKY